MKGTPEQQAEMKKVCEEYGAIEVRE